MGFLKTVGKGLKKAGKQINESAKKYDAYREKNRAQQIERMKSDLEFEKLRTARLQEKEKQNKFQSSSGFGGSSYFGGGSLGGGSLFQKHPFETKKEKEIVKKEKRLPKKVVYY